VEIDGLWVEKGWSGVFSDINHSFYLCAGVSLWCVCVILGHE
jgi:hypothetical protein